MTISFEGQVYEEGTFFYSPDTNRLILLMEAISYENEAYVVLKHHTNIPEVMKANDFANYVMNGTYKLPAESPYKVGDRFTHQLNNETLEIKYVPVIATGTNHAIVYFVEMISPIGDVMYTTVDNTYLSNCVPLAPAEQTLPRPDITEPIEYTIEISEE